MEPFSSLKRSAISLVAGPEFRSVCDELAMAKRQIAKLEQRLAEKALEASTLQARLTRKQQRRDSSGRFVRRNHT
ncbi:hypothetical protein GMO_11680 [Gluconobacter morbifer G707]|uniref:Transposase n=2 Tax=Gluconobacter TaxID=441 RepID=G6XIW8_9PROT|nr:hypothetical protein GMO_11680 [Gluconobacter morbifer G707]